MTPRTFVTLTCFGLVFVVTGLLLTEAVASSVLELSNLKLDSFKKEIRKHDLIFVNFYFSWCIWAKRFAPKYERAAKILAKNKPPVTFAKFNCGAKQNAICENFAKIKASPTVRIYRWGQMIEYDGEYETADLIETARTLLEDPSYYKSDDHFR